MSIQIGSEKHLDLGASIVINKSEETIQADAFKSYFEDMRHLGRVKFQVDKGEKWYFRINTYIGIYK